MLGVTATTDLGGPPPDAATIVAEARARADALAAQAGAVDDVDRILAVAADRFVVRTPNGPTAVAGYPWFGEWSRDLFTSYEGLFLATGRAEEGRAVLVRAAASVSEGMLANTADVGTLEYNTIDATLWFLHALGRHVAPTADLDLAAQLADTVVDILSAHLAGTRFGIGVDPATGLLRGGAEGWALTWMDARIDGRPVTPRAGFPVEIEALWINGLGSAVDLLERVGRDHRRLGRPARQGDRLVPDALPRRPGRPPRSGRRRRTGAHRMPAEPAAGRVAAPRPRAGPSDRCRCRRRLPRRPGDLGRAAVPVARGPRLPRPTPGRPSRP